MALPRIDTPTYDLILASSGETIKYRPFLVKEQKILLLAAEDGKPDAVVNGISQIIENCTFGKVNAKTYLSLILKISSCVYEKSL